jgi:ABC-type multidrug transport system ATPase subunit
MPLLMGLCDRVYAMDAGQVIAVGTPDEIRHHPTVIASYLGTEPVAIARSGAATGRRPRPDPAANGNGRRRPPTPQPPQPPRDGDQVRVGE